jgi:hypothetical protein
VKLAGKPYEIHLLAVIVLYVLGFVVYLNSFSVPFVFDDYPNILDNPSIRLTAIDLEELHATGFESLLGRRPISNISFALNYLAGGYDVKGYHLVNILIHVVNGVLVYFLALILLRKDRTLAHRMPASERRLRLAALFCGGNFHRASRSGSGRNVHRTKNDEHGNDVLLDVIAVLSTRSSTERSLRAEHLLARGACLVAARSGQQGNCRHPADCHRPRRILLFSGPCTPRPGASMKRKRTLPPPST